MNKEMEFPNTFEEFVNEYSFRDSEEIYTNGRELISTFRVMQGYEHFSKQIRVEDMLDTLNSVLKMVADWGYEDLTSVVLRENLKIRIEQLKEDGNE